MIRQIETIYYLYYSWTLKFGLVIIDILNQCTEINVSFCFLFYKILYILYKIKTDKTNKNVY